MSLTNTNKATAMQHTNKKNVLIVHQSTDLYGSDKNILSLATRIDKNLFHCIVLIPCHGPLETELKRHGIEYHICNLLKISRATFSIKNIALLLTQIKKSMHSIDNATGNRTISLVHSNTLAVLSGAIWAKLRKIPHLWNVREMIVRPAIARYIFAFLLHALSTKVVANSNATQKLLTDALPAMGDKTCIVWNGVARESLQDPAALSSTRARCHVPEHHTCVTLVGRINRWKGHDIFVKAATHLWEKGIRDVTFLIVGSPPPGQEFFETNLRHAIERSPARQCFSLPGYAADIWPIWDITDIAVVPSTEPEPFGMVAIEAMLAGKPVIASNHGGLPEIVLSGITGELVPPSDYIALAEAMMKLINHKEYAQSLGDNGRQRAVEHFSMDSVISSYTEHYVATAR